MLEGSYLTLGGTYCKEVSDSDSKADGEAGRASQV